MQDLKSDLIEWNRMQEKINEYQDILSKYREKSKNLEENILNSLENNKISNKKFVLGNHTIGCKDYNKFENITKKYLEETLNKYFNNNNSSKKCVEFIYQRREIIKVKNLIRLKSKKTNLKTKT